MAAFDQKRDFWFKVTSGLVIGGLRGQSYVGVAESFAIPKRLKLPKGELSIDFARRKPAGSLLFWESLGC